MLPRFDYSLFQPTPAWDGCCWLDRDGTIVPVRGYEYHHTLVDHLLWIRLDRIS